MPKKKSPNSVRLRNSTAEFLTFAYQTGGDGVEVRVENGTIWLSEKKHGTAFWVLRYFQWEAGILSLPAVK